MRLKSQICILERLFGGQAGQEARNVQKAEYKSGLKRFEVGLRGLVGYGVGLI